LRAPLDLALRAIAAVAASTERTARLSVLLYHRVLADGDGLNTWDPTAKTFDRQMNVLSTCFAPLRLDDAIGRLKNGTLPAKAVAVTFDDGYADNVDTALPILRRHNVPATFFVTTGYLDGGMMWNDRVVETIRACVAPELDAGALGLGRLPLSSVDERRAAIRRLLAALKHLPSAEREARTTEIASRAGATTSKRLMMDEAGVRTLHGAGMDIGAHTKTHPILTRLTQVEARREISASRDALRSIVGNDVPLFAYPNGKPGDDYAAEHVRMVEEAGFSAAFTTAAGVATMSADVFQLPRHTPWQRDRPRFCMALIANRRNVAPTIVRR
jgi:peptidoglycan/xylan/chitin deacetylase (PgdA/CDA1 family)